MTHGFGNGNQRHPPRSCEIIPASLFEFHAVEKIQHQAADGINIGGGGESQIFRPRQNFGRPIAGRAENVFERRGLSVVQNFSGVAEIQQLTHADIAALEVMTHQEKICVVDVAVNKFCRVNVPQRFQKLLQNFCGDVGRGNSSDSERF